MELLLSIMRTNAGRVIKSNVAFMQAMKYICRVVVLKNLAPSLPTKLFELALSLFLVIATIAAFKPHLTVETSVILKVIFFKILKSSNSFIEHKILISRVMHHLCQDSQGIADFYINFDGDMNFPNILEG